jgi:hypothetical protein
MLSGDSKSPPTHRYTRVPHDALLSRYSSVGPATGAYHAPENRAVVYGSLTHVNTPTAFKPPPRPGD